MPLFLIQDSDRPMWLVAADWGVALSQWKVLIASENDGDDAEPDGIQLVCPDDELMIYGRLPYASDPDCSPPDPPAETEIDLDEPEPPLIRTVHYTTLPVNVSRNSNPVCLGFYGVSMDANDVNCPSCLSIIRQRQAMDMGDWLK